MLNKIREIIDFDKLKKNKELAAKVIAGICIFAITLAIFCSKIGEEEISINADENQGLTNEAIDIPLEQEIEKEKQKIYIDVAGAVNEPKVVCIEGGSRVFEAIAAAGGLSKDADTLDINLAAELTDGEKLYVPRNGDTDVERSKVSSHSVSSSVQNDMVNINNANTQQLQTLKGVGPAMAQKIIDYRNENGPFKTIDDLKNVSGIGEKTFDKLKEKISV